MRSSKLMDRMYSILIHLLSWLPLNFFDRKSSFFLRVMLLETFYFQSKQDHLFFWPSFIIHPYRPHRMVLSYKSNPISWLATMHNQTNVITIVHTRGILEIATAQHTHDYYLDACYLHYKIPSRVCTTLSILEGNVFQEESMNFCAALRAKSCS